MYTSLTLQRVGYFKKKEFNCLYNKKCFDSFVHFVLLRDQTNICIRDFLCAERTPAAFPNKIGEDSLWRKGQKISRSHFVNIERGINKRKVFCFFSAF
jgi:hypothetical protein